MAPTKDDVAKFEREAAGIAARVSALRARASREKDAVELAQRTLKATNGAIDAALREHRVAFERLEIARRDFERSEAHRTYQSTSLNELLAGRMRSDERAAAAERVQAQEAVAQANAARRVV